MTREEAIKVVKSATVYTPEEMEALETLIPELRESEDERIVEDLIGGLMWQRDNLGRLGPHDDNLILPGFCENVGKHLAWLEKQKDASKAIEAVDRIDKYIDEHLANAHDMKDSDPDKKYYRGWDDALGKMSGILQDVYSGEKQKEQPQEELVYRLNGLMQEYIKEGKDEAEKEHRFKCYQLFWDALEDANFFEQKEQKPIVLDEDTQLGIERAIQIVCSAKGKLYAYQSDDGIYECDHAIRVLKNILENGIEQKPAGWSEEDEKKLGKCIDAVSGYYSPEDKQELKNWLKSLRPQPKQEWSEEDEEMLSNLIGHLEVAYSPCDWLTETVAWLKSLSPQPLVEWTEEDRRMLRACIEAVGSMSIRGDVQDLRDWLKSLCPDYCNRPKPAGSWRPSEEQMEALERCVEYLEESDNEDADMLAGLYKQLKAL